VLWRHSRVILRVYVYTKFSTAVVYCSIYTTAVYTIQLYCTVFAVLYCIYSCNLGVLYSSYTAVNTCRYTRARVYTVRVLLVYSCTAATDERPSRLRRRAHLWAFIGFFNIIIKNTSSYRSYPGTFLLSYFFKKKYIIYIVKKSSIYNRGFLSKPGGTGKAIILLL
jgi:hypothetical protein